MYNAQLPSRAELPSSGKLLRSTIVALISAIIILVTIVLPSEYAIDPTGIGAKLGLTQMGEIKMQLAAEAEADAKAQAVDTASSTAPTTAAPTAIAQSMTPVTPPSAGEPAAVAVAPAVTPTPPIAQAATQPANPDKPAAPVGKSDEISFTLKPGQGAEIKLVMKAGAKATTVGPPTVQWLTLTPMETAVAALLPMKKAAACQVARAYSKLLLRAITAGSGAIAPSLM
ncbi:MAG: hypothetical protein LRY61_06870 [Burkholderiaceae bacterium]|nr:hypothetical protein [Burkholderiaceae bacterium]